MSARQHQHMSRREAREYERKLAAERELREAIERRDVGSASEAGDGAASASSAPEASPNVSASAPSDPTPARAQSSAQSDAQPAASGGTDAGALPATASSAGAPASMASAPFFINGQPMTRRQLRELRRAQEAGSVPPLVEPGEQPSPTRSPLAPVELPEMPNVSTGSAPVMPAPLSTPSRPSNTGSPGTGAQGTGTGAQSTGAQSAAAQDRSAVGATEAAASVNSGAATESAPDAQPLRRRDRLRPSAASAGFARSAESAASAQAPEPGMSGAAAQAPASAQPAGPAAEPMIAEPAIAEPTIIESSPFARSAPPAAAPERSAPEVVERSPFAQPPTESAAEETDVADAAQASKGQSERSTEFDSMLTPEVSGSTVSAASLVLPSVPGHTDLPRALDGTGEIIITDSIRLSGGLAATGSHSTGLDGIELDRLLDADDRAASQAVGDSQPVRASKAISTSTATRGVIQTKKPRGNKLLTGLAITASGLAVGVVALLVIGVLNGVF